MSSIQNNDAPAVALQACQLSVTFDLGARKLEVLKNIDLTIEKGQFIVLIGPSGGGKSTLLNAMAGLITPSEGKVLAHGDPVRGPDRDRGMVFQQDTTFPWMRVRRHVGYGLHGQVADKAERERIVDEQLKRVGLSEFEHSWPKELSGGMRKRLAVATAFAADPAILLLDEPFGSLDFVTRAKLHGLLLELWEATKKTLVFVTHDVDEAILLADRIIVLRHGDITDDFAVTFERPRGDDLRTNPEAIALRETLLTLLGLERGTLG